MYSAKCTEEITLRDRYLGMTYPWPLTGDGGDEVCVETVGFRGVCRDINHIRTSCRCDYVDE